MKRFGSVTGAVVLGLGLTACGAETEMGLSPTQESASQALTHGDLHHRDFYYLNDVANNLLAQREHSLMAQSAGQTADTRLYAQRMVDERTCMLKQLQDLAHYRRAALPVQLTPHEAYRADRLDRHRRYSDFSYMYLNYTADNLVKSINYSADEADFGRDNLVRRFANAMVDRLTPDLQNADNLLAGRGLDDGTVGKGPSKGDDNDPKAPVKGDDQTQQDPGKGDDQSQQQQDPAKGDDQSQQQQEPSKGDDDQSQQQQDPGKGDDQSQQGGFYCPDFSAY